MRQRDGGSSTSSPMTASPQSVKITTSTSSGALKCTRKSTIAPSQSRMRAPRVAFARRGYQSASQQNASPTPSA